MIRLFIFSLIQQHCAYLPGASLWAGCWATGITQPKSVPSWSLQSDPTAKEQIGQRGFRWWNRKWQCLPDLQEKNRLINKVFPYLRVFFLPFHFLTPLILTPDSLLGQQNEQAKNKLIRQINKEMTNPTYSDSLFISGSQVNNDHK